MSLEGRKECACTQQTHMSVDEVRSRSDPSDEVQVPRDTHDVTFEHIPILCKVTRPKTLPSIFYQLTYSSFSSALSPLHPSSSSPSSSSYSFHCHHQNRLIIFQAVLGNAAATSGFLVKKHDGTKLLC